MHEVVGAPEGHGGPEENLFLIPVAVTLSIPAVLVAIRTCWAIGRPPRKSFSQRRPPTSGRTS